MNVTTIRIATRQSPLALWQANHIKGVLHHHWPDLQIELVPMVTSGDRFLKDKLLVAGGKGLFVKELEESLLDLRTDIAVHSTKDMPALLPTGLSLAAICQRESPLDALISLNGVDLDSLPKKAIIGTASLRRQSQLLAYRPDLQVNTLRGNVHTRMAKLADGAFDAIILAASGLERMGLHEVITQKLPPELMLPACGQGALCIECRTNDHETQTLIAPLNDPISALCVHTERQVNGLLGGNCHLPLAVFCMPTAEEGLHLRARLLSIDGSVSIASTHQGHHDQALFLASQCTESLLAQGATQLIAGVQ
jgi:hydroxymethylbilane synthase